VAERVQHSVQTGEDFEEDYRVVPPGGPERWINSRGRICKDADGKATHLVGVLMDITRRKQVEQEREVIAQRLHKLTAIHETVLSAISDFAYVFDLEGRFLYANRPLCELYGRSLDEVVGRTFIQLGYPAWHAEMHLREIAQVIATREPIQGEIPFRGESGMSGIYDYIFTPVFGADGRVEAVAGTTRDVSDRKRGEARDRLLVAVDDATRPLIDPQAITHAAARLLGEHLGANRCAYADVEADEDTFNLTGDFNRDVPSIVGRYRFAQFGAECLRLMRAGLPFVVNDAETDPRVAEMRESYRATQIRAVICVPLHKAGRFVAAMAVHQNIVRAWQASEVETVIAVANRSWESIERARVVRVLAESEERLSLAVDTGRLGVWELEFPARDLRCSELAKMIYGRPPGTAFTYADMTAAIFPDDRERIEAVIARSWAEGGGYDVEHRILWPDGTVHWLLVRAQSRLGADRQPLRTVGVIIDITARKETEREQVRLREEAVRASRAKDDFLATLSHELRTPLNPVLLLASEAARDPALDPELRESFETIRKNVELEARLIDDLLDLTSIVRGTLAIRKEARDLHAILADAVASVQPDFEAKGIVLNVSLGARKPLVFVDEVRMAQVFINLLKNAAKFTPDHGSVTLQTLIEGTGVIVVRLTDTGIGLTPAELERVFDAFEQGDHALDGSVRRYGGLGLGLAICQRLVVLHGGEITAASPGRGHGASFTIRLPLHTSADSRASGDQPAPHAAGRPAGAPEPRILLVEDHAATRQTLELLLARRGYRVTTAGTLAEGRTQAARGDFDLLVSDVGLPDGDGAVLMAELRDQRGLKGIALTGYGMDEDIARCRAAGFVAHLTKPIRVEALEAALQESLGA
jgi:PAS domain S-box-containing protein